MFFLSAQPDDFYFLWQLEIQLYNFHLMKIAPQQIHVLIAYDPLKGLQAHFAEFIRENRYATFFTYPDTRVQREYPSGIRPHIIRKHFTVHPWLEGETVFYHDSDLIFRELPDFNSLLRDDCWYMSDTSAYISAAYITQVAGAELLSKMCRIVGIEPACACSIDANAGGAQYLIKEASIGFWEKVEKDSEQLYLLLNACNASHREQQYLHPPEKKTADASGPPQAWCADMWALLWNALLFQKEVRIHRELDFCWTDDPIADWYNKKMLHYSGLVEERKKTVFRKTTYLHHPPYFDMNLDKINPEICCAPLVALINDYTREHKLPLRTDLRDVTFLIPVRIDTASRLENISIITRFLYKYFDTNIQLLESDETSKIDRQLLAPGTMNAFRYDDTPLLHRTKINNLLIRQAQTPLVAIYDTDVIIPPTQIIATVNMLRSRKVSLVTPYDGRFISLDTIFKSLFDKLLDTALLEAHIDKFPVTTHRSFGGAVFVHRQDYMAAGMEDEHFVSWGPEDIERPKRMRILGYKTARIDGPLFHLPHERGLNSGYASADAHIEMMGRYLKITNMDHEELWNDIAERTFNNKSLK
ncbi:galactosyltransferase-related protein [Chitinophaga sp.]|uniref:galactosyltransferase-related protein n=1 Tax=Chitinophaga sp. TaxID=1869181 RepID=UPI0031D18F47